MEIRSVSGEAQPKPVTGIDHALIGLRDLEAGQAHYARLGFTLTPRGSHIGWGTANYCIMFPGDYIELLGIVDASRFTNDLDKFLAAREGLMGLAFATHDANAAAQALHARGIAAEAPKALERRLELPKGTELPRFSLVYLPKEATPDLSAFICQHLTPELLRRPEWLRHANGAKAIASLTAIVDEPAALAAAYERLLGASAVTKAKERVTLSVGRQTIDFVTAERLPALHPGLLPIAGVAPPYLAAMTLKVADRSATAAWLASQALASMRAADGTILLSPEATSGIWLRFE